MQSCKGALSQNSSENKLQLELKNIKNNIFENFKKIKNTPKQKSEKGQQLELKNIKNYIVKNFKN